MIERCMDYRRIKKLVDWPLTISSKVIYLIETGSIKGVDLGVWSFFENSGGYEIHADMKIKGQRAVDSGKAAFKWIFDNTDAEFIKAEILKERRDVCGMALLSGMESLGTQGDFRHFKLMR